MLLLEPRSGNLVPKFARVFKNCCQFFSAPHFALPNFAQSLFSPPPICTEACAVCGSAHGHGTVLFVATCMGTGPVFSLRRCALRGMLRRLRGICPAWAQWTYEGSIWNGRRFREGVRAVLRMSAGGGMRAGLGMNTGTRTTALLRTGAARDDQDGENRRRLRSAALLLADGG